MPEIGGHEFAPYNFAMWPMSVARTNGDTIIASNETEVAEFLKDDPDALKAHNATLKASGEARAIQVKADADIAKIKHDAEMAQAKVMEDAAKASSAPVAPVDAPKPALPPGFVPTRPALPVIPPGPLETSQVSPPRPPVSTVMPQAPVAPPVPPPGRPAPQQPR